MTRLQWDQAGSRRFEAGVDRGVLYTPMGEAVAWSGITSVSDDDGGVTVEEYYLDGVKYLNYRTPGDYGGNLKALTYPDEFLPFDGWGALDDGIFVSNQPVMDTFGLSYRTKVGTDQAGLELGYKLHLLYNLTAKQDATAFNTLGKDTSGEEFSWTLTGVPIFIPRFRPTCHVIIDSTTAQPGGMAIFENFLYGTETSGGMLPDPNTLSDMLVDVILDPIQEPI